MSNKYILSVFVFSLFIGALSAQPASPRPGKPPRGHQPRIEEVTQLVFVALYTALPRFRFQSKLSTFIYRITVNTVSKLLTQENRIVPQSQTDNFLTLRNEETAESQIVKNERYQQLYRCIDRLKQEQRTALVLFSFNDHSYKEIAEIMQISLSKVETLIFRAKRNLREMIEAEDGAQLKARK